MGAPQTLPANFQGWDKTAPDTLPANFNQWDNNHTPQGASPSFWDRVFKSRKYSEESGFAAKQKGQPEGMPGVSEGAGLAGGLAEWDKASGGEIAGGVGDILKGDIAKGLHRMFVGTGHAMTPVMALTLPATIGVSALPRTAATLGGAAIGGTLAEKGAEALGASPEQAQVAGDVGNIAGGVGGSLIPKSVATAPIRAGARGLEAVANSKLRAILNLFTPADEAVGKPIKVPLRDVGLATPEEVNPATVSPSRTMPGQISPEIIGRNPQRAQPIPPRLGLLLSGETAPAPTPPRDAAQILKLLHDFASQIESEAAKPKPEKDLMPELEEMMRRVQAGETLKSFRKPNPQ